VRMEISDFGRTPGASCDGSGALERLKSI
jgi:hypothetical protein